ncbi:MAG: hypothetical protein KDK66_00685 [Deltaproteobacteria bacterium]|nr:hypothetical protein [Deltaproteobacteria bacterium]
MLKDVDYFKKWENEYRRHQKVDYRKNLQIFEALYCQAQALGKLKTEDFLERVLSKSKMVKALNQLTL